MIDWGSLNTHLSFYTYENREDIPDTAGFYAWFLPLWLYQEDLLDLIVKVTDVFSYEPSPEDTPMQYSNIKAELNWTHIDLNLRYIKRKVEPCSQRLRNEWEKALQHPEARKEIEKAMMVASVYMPPLYVGKANSLSIRYAQHTIKSGFKLRFEENMKNIGLRLGVEDLIFSCITTDKSMNAALNSYGLNEILEQALMRVAAPPYSRK